MTSQPAVSAISTSETDQAAHPPLADDPDVVKFARLEGGHYPGVYEPSEFDPALAKQLFDEIIDEAVEAEELGLDGFFFTEHHFDAYSLVPSPNLMIATLAARTSRIRLGAGVYILPANDPVRLAEEAGMLDVLSGGRLEIAVGRGNFDFEADRFTAPVAESRERFAESLEVLSTALRQDWFTFDGRWTQVRKPASTYPRPFQPHIPMWVSAGRPEAIQRVAAQGHNLAHVGFPDGRERLSHFIEAGAAHGRTVTGADFLVFGPVIVAPTDSEAERILYAAATGMQEIVSRRIAQAGNPASSGWTDDLLVKTAIWGSPETVQEKLRRVLEGCGARRFLAIMRFRGIDTAMTRQSQQLFAEKVAPALRKLPA